jgi:hypothetical protein
MKAKSPGFWFFTGDWLKDPELRFCSIFARGLLVDLLCYMFEANEQGYLSKSDGTPRSDESIVDAISGGTREEKLAGLRELELSGALSRDNRGVLYSRRISRLKEISETRKQSGSKGGSKTQAKLKQTGEQSDDQKQKQKSGVSVSDSVSVSDIYSLSQQSEIISAYLKDPEFLDLWVKYVQCVEATHHVRVSSIEQQAKLSELERRPIQEAKEIVRYTITKGARHLIMDATRERVAREPRPMQVPAKPKKDFTGAGLK